MEIVGIIISGVALVAAFWSAIVSNRAKREQRNAARNAAAYTYLANAEALLKDHGELFQLHNIDEQLLRDCNVTPVELLYLTQSFVSADLYHRIEDYKGIWLSDYRKNLLSNEKVRKVWTLIIRDKLISRSAFTDEVDRYIQRSIELEQSKK